LAPRRPADASLNYPRGGNPDHAPGLLVSIRKEGSMAKSSKPIKTLDELFVHTLQDIYYAEQQIVKNLPTMVEKASNRQLKEAFSSHLRETEGHVKRLEQVFQMHGQKAKAVDCEAMDGILAEAKDIIGECDEADVCDAAMLSAAQAVEHYEMSRYGTLVAFAKQLGRKDCADLLDQTLDEEKAADKKLTEIAKAKVNKLAA
jgi:ferritin-like metal-binding protein YciE